MNQQALIDALAASAAPNVPARADVLELQQLTPDDLRARLDAFVALVGRPADDREKEDCKVLDLRENQTTVPLAGGARAVLYHASGALRFTSGMPPLSALFPRVESGETLVKRLNEAAQKLRIGEWCDKKDRIAFERLFQTKAQGMDRAGKMSAVVLSRAVGAFRHHVGAIPVLGAASVAIQLAGNGQLDALRMQVRPRTGTVIENAPVLDPKAAARQIVLQLSALLGGPLDRMRDDMIESKSMRFGYLDLGKRKAQRLLAPAFLAEVVLRHDTNRQAYVLAAPGTEKQYMEIPMFGVDPPVTRTHADKGCCDRPG
jgi:hypothetical protein